MRSRTARRLEAKRSRSTSTQVETGIGNGVLSSRDGPRLGRRAVPAGAGRAGEARRKAQDSQGGGGTQSREASIGEHRRRGERCREASVGGRRAWLRGERRRE